MTRVGDQKRDDIFRFVTEYWLQFQVGPPVRTIGKAMDIGSTQTVHYHLRKMVEQGVLRHTPEYAPRYFVPELRTPEELAKARGEDAQGGN